MRLFGFESTTGRSLRAGLGLRALICSGLVPAALLWAGTAVSQEPNHSSPSRYQAETIYVPAYSHILTQPDEKHPLATTLVVHNVDRDQTITLISVRYYDHKGEMIKDYATGELTLTPFASANFTTFKRDDEGGVGANFIVEWEAASPALSPVAEAVIVGGGGTLGISFTSRGRTIARR